MSAYRDQPPAPASEDPLVILRRARRRQRSIVSGIAGLCLLAAAVFWFAFKSKLPAPDARVLSDLRLRLADFNGLPSELRPRAAAEMFRDLETNRLPSAQRQLFEHAESGSLGGLQRQVVEAIEEGQLKDDWRLACPNGGALLFDAISERKGYEQGQYVFRRCELGRFGFLTEEEAGHSDVGHLMLAYIAYAFLYENNAVLDEEQALLRHFTQNTAQLASEQRGGVLRYR